ncbi:MAG: hypothetical protein ACR2MX_11615, partial [Cyclobacteriaceae bacterium]
MNYKLNVLRILLGGLLTLSVSLTELQAQQHILIEEQVRAGDLTLFRHLKNENEYYYVLDRARIAKSENGTPLFSFTKYVRNTSPDEGVSNITESEHAGGMVHVVLTLSLSESERSRAEQELRRINSKARIVGPVNYTDGTVELVRTLNQDGMLKAQGEYEVLGIKRAPLLEGQKIAFSIELDKERADILWETLQTPAPGLFFSFKMQAKGYSSPVEAIVKADLERIYSSHSFQAAAVTPVYSAEIDVELKKLHEEKAIQIVQIGSDADMEKVLANVNQRIIDLIFDKSEGFVQGRGANSNQNKSALERATSQLTKARAEAKAENAKREAAKAKERQTSNSPSSRPATPRRRPTATARPKANVKPGASGKPTATTRPKANRKPASAGKPTVATGPKANVKSKPAS